MFNAYARIIDSIADDRLRIILYHIPQMSAVPISHALIERLLTAYPKTVVGIKDSAGDFANMQAMVKAFPGFSVLAGADPLMKPLLEAGGHGCITATSNLVGKQLATVFAPLRRCIKDKAKSKPHRTTSWRCATSRTSSRRSPRSRRLLAHRYGDDAWANVRPPLVKLTAAQRAELAGAMDGLPAP